jgi:N-acetylglucosaminyl-diphospho-decaprenol L-rhamnosyltransferase
MKRLAIGMVTFNNSAEDLEKFVRSLDVATRRYQKATGQAFEPQLYYIDNGKKSYLHKMKNCTQVKSMGNVGYPKALNSLIKRALEKDGYSHFLSANPDGVFHPDFFIELFKFSEKFPNDLIEAIQFPEEHPKNYDRVTFETEWASGCCCLFSKQLIKEVGYLDEHFFLYVEDVDYSWRVRLKGFKIRICPKAIFGHFVLNRKPSPLITKYFYESGRYLGLKYRNKAFRSFCEKVLIDEKIYPSVAAMPKYKNLKTVRSKNLQQIADFKHMFHFSEVRWG